MHITPRLLLSVFSVLTLYFVVGASCSSDDPEPQATDCSTSAATFTQANAVIQSNCATNSGCHASGSVNGPGALTNYTQIFAARTSIRSAVSSGTMPQNGKLSDAQKAAIICWIDAGAPNN